MLGKYAPQTFSPRPGERWVHLPLDDDWAASYRVVEQDGELVVAEIRVQPAPRDIRQADWFSESFVDPELPLHSRPEVPAGGLGARQAKAGIRTGEALRVIREHDDRVRERPPLRLRMPGGEQIELPARRFSDAALDAPRRVGRKGRPDRYYAQIARAYLAAINAGSRSPVVAVAEQLGPGHSAEYVRDALHRARQRDLLTRPARGRAGGRLTSKGQAALANEDKEQP